MVNKYCDCGHPFPIHDADDPNCSKVLSTVPDYSVTATTTSALQESELLGLTRKVSSLANTLSGVMTGLGILTLIGGLVLTFQSNTIDLGNGYAATTHPYVQVGIIIIFAGLFETLVFRLIFNYIQMQAGYREWQLTRS